jgi:hypothetical protein
LDLGRLEGGDAADEGGSEESGHCSLRVLECGRPRAGGRDRVRTECPIVSRTPILWLSIPKSATTRDEILSRRKTIARWRSRAFECVDDRRSSRTIKMSTKNRRTHGPNASTDRPTVGRGERMNEYE